MGLDRPFWIYDTKKADNPIGMVLKTVDVTPTGCMLYFVQNDENITGQLQTGQPLVLQKKDKDGNWVEMPMLDDAGWEDIAYDLKSDSVTELYQNWENIFGILEEGHYKITKSVMDYRAPGDYDTYDVLAEFTISNDSGESVTDWLSVELPQGYGISNYYDNIGYMGGSLILPKSYDVKEPDESGFSPLEWRYSGLISRIPAGQTDVEYENGIPKLSGIPMQNHSEQEYIDVIGLERSTNQWLAIMLKVNHDLYTPSQLDDLQKKGITVKEEDTTSDYWEFWFVKQGEETYYVVTLSAKEFSQKEAKEIARSVTIK